MTDRQAQDTQTAIYRAALDAMPEPVLIYDDTQVLYANAAANHILGGSESADLRGTSVANFILPEYAEVNNARRAYVIEQGVEIKDLLVKVRGLDGKPAVLQIDIRPISFDGSTAALATLSRR